MLDVNLAILSCFFIILTPTLSLYTRDLVLPSLTNATGALGLLNRTAFSTPVSNLSATGAVQCTIRRGRDLNLESCENAWLKIPVELDTRVFRHRYENPPADTVYDQSHLSATSLLAERALQCHRTILSTSSAFAPSGRYRNRHLA